jgi:hypothetical protein
MIQSRLAELPLDALQLSSNGYPFDVGPAAFG